MSKKSVNAAGYSEAEQQEMMDLFEKDADKALDAWGTKNAVMILAFDRYLEASINGFKPCDWDGFDAYQNFLCELERAREGFEEEWCYVTVDLKTYLKWALKGSKVPKRLEVKLGKKGRKK